MADKPGRLAVLPFGSLARPVLEFVGAELAAEIGEAQLQARLRVADGLVVDDGSDLFKEVIEELARGKVSEGLGQVLLKVLLDGGDGVCARLL